MGRNRLMVTFPATVPSSQIPGKRQNIANAAGMNLDDVIAVEGATSVAVMPSEPDTGTVDLIRAVLEANRHRLRGNDLVEVAIDVAWAVEHR